MTTLYLDNVTKVYDGAKERAVDTLTMHIDDGEIVALLGSSGCGKTTTLRMVAGLESVTDGEIRVGDRLVNTVRPSQRNVAMAFETYALYPPLRVRENIAFGLLRDRVASAVIEKQVKQIAGMLEITDLLERFPPSISGGAQQRVSLARALIRNAAIYLLDEPMSQLEPQLRALLRARIKDYLIAHKMTTVVVTHDQTEAIALADRIAVMEKGVLQQFATPHDLQERPANLFVASFIGEPPMNLFPAVVQDGEIAVLNERQEVAFHVPLDASEGAGKLGDGRRIMVGVRPHRVHLAPTGQVKGATLVGEVSSNHWLGDHSQVGFQVRGCSVVAVGGRDTRAPLGSQMPVVIPVEAVRIFDAGSGAAIQHDAARAASLVA
ncbi:ABC transporter ATP-binding protein [Mycobacterium sp.]|uniref:ABC transporter ATP-binding protein n=1 Tax=Mycobacterium sp. TaxID=1785 RepID=UPI003F9BDD08